MNKKFLLVSLVTTIVACFVTAAPDQRLFMGAIQFPKMRAVPPIPMYQGGTKISCEVDQDGYKVTYSLRTASYTRLFYLIIAAPESFVVESEDNTIQQWKVLPGVEYKMYAMQLNEDNAWTIKELRLPLVNQHIPDETIRVCCDPRYVAEVIGGSSFELPKIAIKHDVMLVAGSREAFYDNAIKAVLASLDYDAVHARPRTTIVQQGNTILAHNIPS